MEVILLDDVIRLGRRGDVVDVAEGYGRNYLIPKQLAVVATPGAMKNLEQQRAALAKKEAKDRDAAELLSTELSQLHILISRKSGETGVLFGSVTSKDIGDALEAGGVNLDRRRILLEQPIKRIGTIEVETRPHPDVSAPLLVSVLPEAEEAVSKTMRRGLESDKILEQLEEKVREIRQLAGKEESKAPAEEPAPVESDATVEAEPSAGPEPPAATE